MCTLNMVLSDAPLPGNVNITANSASSSITTTLAPSHPNPSQSTAFKCNPEAISGGPNSVVVGVLASIIVVLLFLLLLAVLGLAYPRCIRSKVKDKKHFSRYVHWIGVVCYYFVVELCVDYTEFHSFWMRRST